MLLDVCFDWKNDKSQLIRWRDLTISFDSHDFAQKYSVVENIDKTKQTVLCKSVDV